MVSSADTGSGTEGYHAITAAALDAAAVRAQISVAEVATGYDIVLPAGTSGKSLFGPCVVRVAAEDWTIRVAALVHARDGALEHTLALDGDQLCLLSDPMIDAVDVLEIRHDHCDCLGVADREHDGGVWPFAKWIDLDD